MVNVRYFASLRESIGRAEEHLDIQTPTTVTAVVEMLVRQGDVYAASLASNKQWRVAVNHEMVGLDAAVASGDEIAFFPPVTGG